LRESAAEMVNLEGVANTNPDMLTLNNSLSNIHLDKEALAQRDEEAQFLRQLEQEKLPGMVKSKWALTYKLKMDKAIEDALDHEEEVAEKVKTKGRFQIQACTNAGNWIRDRQWIYLANPRLKAVEEQREKFDTALLDKRREQKLIQYMALEQQYNIVVKKPKGAG